MKIAVASSGLGHVSRGIETWAVDLARTLVDRGLDVTLYKGGGQPGAAYERVLPCWRRTSAETNQLLERLPRRLVWRLGVTSAYGIEQTTFAWHLLRELRRNRIDILHVQDPQVALIAQWARRLGWVRTRTILAHGTEESFAFQRRITFLQHLAPWHLQEARFAGAWRPTWTAIPNFIDTDCFRPGGNPELRRELGIPQRALVVLSVAAIKRRHKRIDHLLNEFAWLFLHRPDLPLWLVVAGGREEETDRLVEQGRTMLGQRVRFLVNFPRARMPELYQTADLFTLASLKEMMPIAVLEATASGLPCLLHTHPVLQWMAGPGGVSLNMAEPHQLAAELERLHADPAQRRRLGEQARQHCLANFSRQRVVDQIVDYYRFVLRVSSRAARNCQVSPAVRDGLALVGEGPA